MDWLEASFGLDRMAAFLRGRGMDHTKKSALEALARVLDDNGVPWAIIGGIALQAHVEEPRFTKDIDVAVLSRALLPREALAAAGFAETGRFAYSDNFSGFGVPVRFSDEPAFAEAIRRAETHLLETVQLKVIGPLDLARAKLRAASEPLRARARIDSQILGVEAPG